jgi:hypothetical protein
VALEFLQESAQLRGKTSQTGAGAKDLELVSMFGQQGAQNHDPALFADDCGTGALQQIKDEVWQALKREHVKPGVSLDFGRGEKPPFDLVSSLPGRDKHKRISHRGLEELLPRIR